MATLVLLSLLGFFVLFVGAFKQKALLLPVIISGLAVSLVLNYFAWGTGTLWFGMFKYDNFAIAFSSLMIVVTLLIMLVASWQFRNEDSGIGDIYALMIFALVGGMIMTAYSSMVMLFIGIEILSIALYVLAGSRRMNLASNEAGLKYFLLGAFASGFLLFGITLIFGVTNTFDIYEISDYVNHRESLPLIFYAGTALLLIGFTFKIGAVPFHFWAPDVYQGSPTLITAFMATVVKTAGIAAFYRMFNTCFSSIDGSWYLILWGIAVATILLGNLSAVMQHESKRLLAWSSVSHAGYLLLPILALNELSAGSILYYSAAYSFASIIAFSVVIALSGFNNELPLDDFRGLAKNNGFLAFSITVAMLSLAGIPPLAGFLGKYFVFATALQSNLVVGVVIAVIGSLIGLYYYLRPIVYAYNTEGPAKEKIETGMLFRAVLIICLLLVFILGIFPDTFMNLLSPLN